MKSEAEFYKKLPALDSFFEAADYDRYRALPDDWHVALSDIVHSTEAIKKGKYKMVNILGAAPIIGILNASGKEVVPYSFQGDGCAFCIPPGLSDKAGEVLAACRRIGRETYGLDLRVGVIPIREIRNRGKDIRVAKYRVSDIYRQALFCGGGLECAEELLRDSKAIQHHLPKADAAATIDFSGLECRWKETESEGKNVLTLLVKANPDKEEPSVVYNRVMENMRITFGFNGESHPVSADRLRMHLSPFQLLNEVQFRTFGRSRLQQLAYFVKVVAQSLLGKLFMALGYTSSKTDWSIYKSDLVLNMDYRKFDDMLRVVIGATDKQYRDFLDFLEQMHQDRALAYGAHIADKAIITCMVFTYHRQHIHFVDGGNGGYAQASKDLKRRMKKMNTVD